MWREDEVWLRGNREKTSERIWRRRSERTTTTSLEMWEIQKFFFLLLYLTPFKDVPRHPSSTLDPFIWEDSNGVLNKEGIARKFGTCTTFYIPETESWEKVKRLCKLHYSMITLLVFLYITQILEKWNLKLRFQWRWKLYICSTRQSLVSKDFRIHWG